MEVSFPEPYRLKEGYMHVPVPSELFQNMPDTLAVDGTELKIKSEFHISLFELEHLASFLVQATEKSFEEVQENVLSIFSSYVAKKPMTFTGFLDDFRVVEKEERKSIVVRCQMENLNGFFEALESTFGASVYRQPAHVTIYTLGHNKGIGIHTVEEIESLPKLELPHVFTKLGV